MVLSAVLKTEPLSPSVEEELTWFSEETLYSSLEHDDFKLETDIFPSDTKVQVASQLLENLESLVNIDELIKEEPFFMSDVKILPMLEEIEQSRYPLKNEILHDPTILKANAYKNESLMYAEFTNVYNTQTLTPPQSPPCQEPAILTTLKPLESPGSNFNFFHDKQHVLYEQFDRQLLDNVLYRPVVEYPAAVTPQPDIAHELAVVDELVRSRVENMQWSSTPSSPASNSGNSSSSFDDCSSDDPEWAPEANESNPSDETVASKSQRKRTKPYSRCSPEDKKSRKKEQNKNAATRYRLKKKAEVEEILSEEKNLMNEGEKLNEKISDIQREIKYLKGLMRDLFKAKGLI